MTISPEPVKSARHFQMRKESEAMRDDEDAPPRPRSRLEKLPLDTLGVEELAAYVDELRQEIARVEAESARKQSHRNIADNFFRKS